MTFEYPLKVIPIIANLLKRLRYSV